MDLNWSMVANVSKEIKKNALGDDLQTGHLKRETLLQLLVFLSHLSDGELPQTQDPQPAGEGGAGPHAHPPG